jgi:alkanesulfonate monooxygenase SsuD/methylene tetrahydromethanopterin reductase-like flavin-dependent oxidoreductase (luciferase family)
MELSLYLDLRARQGAPPTPDDLDDAVRLVRDAERLGFLGVWTTEQHGVDDGYLPAQFPALAAFARETSTLRLGAGVVLLPLTHPRRVVEEACVVDALSHGRLTLGLGAGNYPNEFRIFGVPMQERRRLMDEGVAFVRAGLSGGLLADGSPVNIPPVQEPIPLVLGGLVRPAIDRAARLADGHFAYAFDEPERDLPEMYRTLVAPALDRAGRAPEDFRVLFASVFWVAPDPAAEWRDVVGPAFAYQQRKYAQWEQEARSAGGYSDATDLEEARNRLFVGRPDEIAERLLHLRERYPFDEVVFWARLPGVPFELATEHLHRVADEVLPRIGARGSRSEPPSSTRVETRR